MGFKIIRASLLTANVPDAVEDGMLLPGQQYDVEKSCSSLALSSDERDASLNGRFGCRTLLCRAFRRVD
jgi:hypothetical protein